MSTIIKFIITYALYFLVALAAALLVAYIETRKFEKHISNKMSTFRESGAARTQSQDEASAQVDEIHESADEIHEDMDEIHESIDEIGKSLDKMSESVDKMSESMDRIIEFKRLMRDYSNYKIKMIEARENFREPEFSDEKNIH